jgi:hypothetical protein
MDHPLLPIFPVRPRRDVRRRDAPHLHDALRDDRTPGELFATAMTHPGHHIVMPETQGVTRGDYGR